MKQIMFALAIIFCMNGYSVNKESYPTSLKEAYEIAIKEAKKWNDNAKLYRMISVGNKEDSYENMIDGKRLRWNFSFGVPNSIGSYDIMVHNREVVLKLEVPEVKFIYPFVEFDKINIDSIDALEIAKKNFDIQPGAHWAKGYHFKLYKIEDNNILQVVCDDSDGYVTKIGIDATTKEIIYGIHKVPSGGGLYKMESDKLKYLNKDLDIIDVAVSPNFKKDKTMVTVGFNEELEQRDSVSINLSTNNGEDWIETELQAKVMRIWFSDDYKNNKSIYILTEKNIYEYSTETNKRKSLCVGVSDFIYGDSYKDKIALLTKEKILLSEDRGLTWDSIPIVNGIKKINLDKKGNLLGISDKEVFKLENNKLIKIKSNLDGELLNSHVINDNNLIVNNFYAINILNYSTESIYTIDIPYRIKEVFLDYNDGVEGHFYVWTFNNKIIEIQKEGERYKKSEKSLLMPSEGEIIKIVSGEGNVFYYCMVELEQWKDIH